MKLNWKLVPVALMLGMLALTGCGGGSDDTQPPEMPTGPTPEELAAMDREAISDAIDAAKTAVAAVDNDSTAAEVGAADGAIMAARNAIAGADNIPAAEKAANTGTVDALAGRLNAAKEARMAAMDEAQRAADMAMAATAAKLYAGIYTQAADNTGTAVGAVHAAYNADDTGITVTIGDGTTANPTELSEDKKAMIADNHGWKGKRYADASGGDEYEAVVYSNVEAPKMGRKFGSADAVTPTGAYEYQLANGALALTPADVSARVALPGVTRTAGTETFNLPSPNPGGATNILVSGSFHGVSGTYSCTPTTPADGCTAAVAASGFLLGGGTWTFTPSSAEARVMDSEDTAYASYGWWIKKAEHDGPLTASAFVDEKGTVDAASGLNDLNGTATYMGGAAGKYALSSSTGGTNDAGHFTARATLEANFTNNTAATAITGTIDNFMGADGMSRDWSVKLNGSAIADTGGIGEDSDTTPDNGPSTVWTIGETAAAAAGGWTGALRNNGDDGVPQVATGTFYSEYGTAGKMVGAFGANEQ